MTSDEVADKVADIVWQRLFADKQVSFILPADFNNAWWEVVRDMQERELLPEDYVITLEEESNADYE